MAAGTAGPEGRWKVEAVEGRTSDGKAVSCQRYEAELAVAGFVRGAECRAACEQCPRHGRNLACPPHSPFFADAVGLARIARVLCLRVPLDPVAGATPEERYRSAFRAARSLLVEELLQERDRGREVLGSGPCLACESCAAEEGETRCRKPAERIFSLESTGVNVVELLRTCFGLELEWTAEGQAPGFVCSVGAVFGDGD